MFLFFILAVPILAIFGFLGGKPSGLAIQIILLYLFLQFVWFKVGPFLILFAWKRPIWALAILLAFLGTIHTDSTHIFSVYWPNHWVGFGWDSPMGFFTESDS